jgi:glycosyltransferase involved in cell wall biosynthesis
MGHISRFDPASWLTYLNPGVDRIVCVSEAVRRYLLGFRLPPERLVTIHKGHDPAWYTGLPAPDRAELGLPADAVVVGFTGNMRPVKGADVLLRAARRLQPRPDLHFLLIGEIRDARIRRLAAAPEMASVLHLPGFRKDAAALARLCDVAVMPSVKREGLPRAVIEAMAQGVPAVVTDVGGMPELVEHGVSGLVVPPRDDAALAEALRTLADDPALRARMGRAATERIGSAFHIRTTILKMRALLEDLQSDTPRK